MKEWKRMKVLNIYGQFMEHSDACIVGNREALEALRDKITKALETGGATLGEEGVHRNPNGAVVPQIDNIDPVLFTSDGEGYELKIKCAPGDWDNDFWGKEENRPLYFAYANQDRGPWEDIPKEIKND